ncbi:hypothetical protein ANO11243_080410 [Dothideomycetidae sp. 11243]|nr:hypothetical protein ANO11243_080410 [fungal sp. No.11243]
MTKLSNTGFLSCLQAVALLGSVASAAPTATNGTHSFQLVAKIKSAQLQPGPVSSSIKQWDGAVLSRASTAILNSDNLLFAGKPNAKQPGSDPIIWSLTGEVDGQARSGHHQSVYKYYNLTTEATFWPSSDQLVAKPVVIQESDYERFLMVRLQPATSTDGSKDVNGNPADGNPFEGNVQNDAMSYFLNGTGIQTAYDGADGPFVLSEGTWMMCAWNNPSPQLMFRYGFWQVTNPGCADIWLMPKYV